MKFVFNGMLLVGFCLAGVVSANPVQTKSGFVSGVVLEDAIGLEVFRGVPYAEPPVGELRWRPPQEVKPWNGVYSSDSFCPACPQKVNSPAKKYFSEDCLYLNVWTTRANQGEAKLPVMVWIHGGGLNRGWGDKKFYDGSAFAKRGVVLVSVNYRLGALGFLAHPALSAESDHGVSGNYGFMDQVAALKWVRDNIAGFGGDPGNVTIFGESAGGTSVSVLCASPQANGLFHRAIIQSPWMFGYIDKLAEPNVLRLKEPVASTPSAEETGVQWAKGLSEKDGTDALEELRKLSPQALMGAVSYYRTRATIDGWFLPDHPANVFAAGQQANVPVMIGTTKDEGNYFRAFVNLKDRQHFRKKLSSFYGDRVDSVLDLYPGETDEELKNAGSLYVTDSWFVHPARQLLEGMSTVSSPAYQYQFSRPNRNRPLLGAPHATELRYVFNTLTDAGEEPADQKLADTVMNYWVQFARTGNPNAPGLPEWSEYTETQPAYLDLDVDITTGAGLKQQSFQVLERAMEGIYR